MDLKKDFFYLLAFLGLLFIIWIFTGGPARYETAKPFIETPGRAPLIRK
jgi:hypothetical protein